MKASTDEALYATMYLETPFAITKVRTNSGELREAESAREAMTCAGCHLKSRERLSDKWPRYFGTLTSYSERVDHVVVISKPPTHGIDGKPTVWRGTLAEYLAMWECD